MEQGEILRLSEPGKETDNPKKEDGRQNKG